MLLALVGILIAAGCLTTYHRLLVVLITILLGALLILVLLTVFWIVLGLVTLSMTLLTSRLDCFWRQVLLLMHISWISFIREALLLEVASLHHWNRSWVYNFAFAPVDCSLNAHVTTNNLLVHRLDKLRNPIVVVLRAQHHHIVICRSSLDISEQLVVPLDLVYHLAMNVLNVEVLPCNDQSATSYPSIESQPIGSHLVYTERIVPRCLLKWVNRVQLVRIRGHWASAAAHLLLVLRLLSCLKSVVDLHLWVNCIVFRLPELLLLKIS